MSGFVASYPVHPPYIAGNRYSLHEGAAASTVVTAVDILYCHLFRVETPLSFSAGAVRTVTGGAGSSVKAGIWANSRVSGRPLGAPLFKDDVGAVTTGSNTTVTMAFGSGSLAPGWYWFGSKYTGTLPTMAAMGSNVYFVWATGMPSASSPNVFWASYADAYANACPTIAEGATFAYNNSAACPIGFLLAA